MSFVRSLAAARPRFVRPSSVVPMTSRTVTAAPFHSSSLRAAGKESSLPDEDDRGNRVEQLKHEQIKKAKEGKGHWHRELGSDSEEAIKADRGEADPTPDNIEKLQKDTSEHVESRKKEGKEE